jgi:hypothetical protein
MIASKFEYKPILCQEKNWTYLQLCSINTDISKKDIVMSADNTGTTRRGFLKQAAAAGLSAAALCTFGAGEAEAQGQFRNITPYDMRGAELWGVRAASAEASADRVAIAAYGDDQAFIDAIERAVLYIRSQGVPVDLVWADNVHAGGHNAINIYIEGIRIIPKDGHPPFAIDSNPNDVAQALVFSFNYWKSLAQAPGPAPTGG